MTRRRNGPAYYEEKLKRYSRNWPPSKPSKRGRADLQPSVPELELIADLAVSFLNKSTPMHVSSKAPLGVEWASDHVETVHTDAHAPEDWYQKKRTWTWKRLVFQVKFPDDRNARDFELWDKPQIVGQVGIEHLMFDDWKRFTPDWAEPDPFVKPVVRVHHSLVKSRHEAYWGAFDRGDDSKTGFHCAAGRGANWLDSRVKICRVSS